MKLSIGDEQYYYLAELRYRIRIFLQSGDIAAQALGVEPRQYHLLLAIRGLNPGQPCTVRALSERLLLKHHSTVELIDRLEANGLVIRSRDREDRRRVFVRLQPKGERLLEVIVRKRVHDIDSGGREFVKALKSLLNKTSGNGNGAKRLNSRISGRTERTRPAVA